jgi:hypothetical protein
MSKDDSGIDRRSRKTEFSQVVSPNVTPNRRRRNSMPLPVSHGGMALPMVRRYQPPVHPGGGQHWYHVTTPQNFERIQQSGGLMPHTLQPSKGVGLDESTGRGTGTSWMGQLRDISESLGAVRLEQQFDFLGENTEMFNLAIRRGEQRLRRTAREGINPENLYMSANIGSSLDYLHSESFHSEGAVLMRVPRERVRGFRRDVQGKQQDYRALGMVIPSRHIEFAEIPSGKVGDFANMEERQAKRALRWQPMNPPKAQPVRFQWQSGSCAPEERLRHGFGGPKRGPEGGGSSAGIVV